MYSILAVGMRLESFVRFVVSGEVYWNLAFQTNCRRLVSKLLLNNQDMSTLHQGMSVEEFDNEYFYASELRAFARDLGITVGNFRKFELEELIREFLQTGKVPDRKPVLPRKAGEARDVLKADTTVTNYIGDKKAKVFLLELIYAELADLGPLLCSFSS